jgi:hypothetical protein
MHCERASRQRTHRESAHHGSARIAGVAIVAAHHRESAHRGSARIPDSSGFAGILACVFVFGIQT